MLRSEITGHANNSRSDDPTLRLKHVSKSFPGQLALHDVSLCLPLDGEIHGLVGQNGSGKSTLIKILAGFHDPDPGGEVWLHGTRIDADRRTSARRGLRFVHQGLGLINELDAVDNMALVHGYGKSVLGHVDRARQAMELRHSLARIGVSTDLWTPVGQLPPVERTAIAIARAIEDLHEAGGLLVLDEPTAALTPREVDRLFSILAELKDAKVSILYVSHRMQELFQVTDKVSVLRSGRLVSTADTSDLDHDRLVELMVGASDSAVSVRGSLPMIDCMPSARSTKTPRSRPEMDGAPETALTVRGLTVGGLKNLSFDLRRGEILGVAGFTGTGREALPYAVVGALPGVAGEVKVGNGPWMTPVSLRAAKESGFALLPADRRSQSGVMPFSVAENMTLATLKRFRKRLGMSADLERRETDRWMNLLDVQPRDGQRTLHLLSGGNQQKAVLAKWLMTDPSVMLIDEPTNGVDLPTRRRLYDLIRSRASRGIAFVLCSSDIEELAEISTRVLVLHPERAATELVSSEISEHRILGELMERREDLG